MNPTKRRSNDRATLAAIARRAMIERGLEPDFPPTALQELAAIGGPAVATDEVRDLRNRLPPGVCSIS
jgi:exoribonuclease-2